MKILCEYTPCGPTYVRSGWGKVFQNLGHTFKFWQPEMKAAFDVFSEYEPDLFIGTSYGIDRAIYKNIVARPKMKVILYASAWGKLIEDIDLKRFPIVVTTDEEKKTLEKLKKETGQPEFVFIHYHDNWMERTMGGWKSIGIKPVSMLNAADLYDYTGGVAKKELESDLSFVGGYWSYKSQNLDKYILPLCHGNKYNIKIFGNQPWNVAQYLGYVDTPDVKNIFKSAKICPNVSEPHSTEYGFDVIERPYKVLADGNFCISDYVQSGVEDIFKDTVPVAKTPKEFKDLIDYYLDKPEERAKIAKEGQKLVLDNHTYFDRVRTIFQELQMFDEVKKTTTLKNTFILQES